MNHYLNKHRRSITRKILFVFVLSWFSLIGQASAHTFMMAEMQHHKSMGHNMGGHCPPVLCESVISLDDQTGHGLGSLQLVDLAAIPAAGLSTFYAHAITLVNSSVIKQPVDYGPPPLQLSGILRI